MKKSTFIKSYANACWPIVIPTCLVGIIGIVLFWFGYGEFAAQFTWFGSALTVLGALVFILLNDSKKRWPNDNMFVRFAKIVTFSRT